MGEKTMVSVEKKKNFIINTAYAALVVTLFYFFMKYAFGLFFPFLCAMAVAKVLQKPVDFLCRKTPVKRGFASVLMVMLAVIVILAVFVLIIVRIGIELKGFFDFIMIRLEDVPSFIASIEQSLKSGLSFLPDKIEGTITSFIGEKLAILLNSPDKPQDATLGFDFSVFGAPLSGVWNTAKQIPSTLIGIVIAVVACCFMTADFATLRKVILSLFRDDTREKIIRSKRLLLPAMGKMAKAYGLIMTITFCELALGLFLLKLIGIYSGGYILIISLITAIIDIIPILGTGLVLVPWGLYSLLTGSYSFGIGILILYVCILVIRQIIEPKLVADQLGLPAFATIIAMFVGTQIFGFIGLFLLPITLAMVKLLNDEGIICIFHEVDKKEEAEIPQEEAPLKEEVDKND